MIGQGDLRDHAPSEFEVPVPEGATVDMLVKCPLADSSRLMPTTELPAIMDIDFAFTVRDRDQIRGHDYHAGATALGVKRRIEYFPDWVGEQRP